MESLALLVVYIYLILIAISLATFVFSLINRSKGRFRKTAVVLFALTSLIAIWATSIIFALGFIPLLSALLSGLMLFLPKKEKTKD